MYFLCVIVHFAIVPSPVLPFHNPCGISTARRKKYGAWRWSDARLQANEKNGYMQNEECCVMKK